MPGPLADGFEALENGDVLGVVGRHRLAPRTRPFSGRDLRRPIPRKTAGQRPESRWLQSTRGWANSGAQTAVSGPSPPPFRAVLTRAHPHLDRGHRRALDDRREPGEELGLEVADWVAQAGSSTAITSRVPSSESGRQCAASGLADHLRPLGEHGPSGCDARTPLRLRLSRSRLSPTGRGRHGLVTRARPRRHVHHRARDARLAEVRPQS